MSPFSAKKAVPQGPPDPGVAEGPGGPPISEEIGGAGFSLCKGVFARDFHLKF
eukprot:NODE_3268_length_954_cov_3.300552_g2714_i0.p4 GENE.NODE_3268_length_954_cov_3.300552_g2714_i0~~NODE_3268_length_954_cov_3.300552_g2714_i0.p4  ORF type:complete len:53 (-),score=4.63 NODE_3268_length_954_cov_3.300552_g2714_i0:32-190(-)